VLAISGKRRYGRTTFLSPYRDGGVERSNARSLEQTLAVPLPAPLACCRFALERRRMIPPPNFALRIIVEEEPKLVRKLNADYADAAPDGGVDIAARDALLDVLGKHFTGLWPRSGGMEAIRPFMVAPQRAMARARRSVDFFALA
jgi:hypothetical protein